MFSGVNISANTRKRIKVLVFEEKKVVEALSSYSMYLGDSPYKLPGFFSILPYGELQYGLWMPKGGMYGLVEGLIKLNQEKDVKINTSPKIKKL